MSGVTDVALISPQHFVSASYGARELYLWEFDLEQQCTRLLAHASATFRGEATVADLIDWDGDHRIVTSNFLGKLQRASTLLMS